MAASNIRIQPSRLNNTGRKPTHNTSTLTTAFLNVCSLRHKVAEVKEFLAARGIGVFGIAETWLKPDITDGELTIPHFRLYRKDRRRQTGGGVAIYCHESLTVRRRRDLESNSLEILWLEVHANSDHILIGCCYRPPNMLVDYWDAVEQNFAQAFAGRQTSTLLLGDFNVDYNKPSSPEFRSLHHILTQFNLQNFVSSPTRVTSHSSSTIDLLLSTSPIHGTCRLLSQKES